MLSRLQKLDDVPDDEEVAREIELVDHVELFGDLCLGASRERPEAGASLVPGDLTQVGAHRLAGRQRVVRKSIPEIGEGEIEPLGERGALGHGVREIGEELGHLARGLQMALAVLVEPAAGGVEIGVEADARQDVVQRLVAAPGVAHSVGGHEWQPQPSGQLDERLVAPLFVAQPVALQLDVEPAVEDPPEVIDSAAGRLEAAVGESADDRPLGAAGETVKPRGMLFERHPRHRGFTFRPADRGGGQQPAKIPVPLAAGDQQGQSGLWCGKDSGEGRKGMRGAGR